ncbi:hypothetical protein BHM03_00012895, partial [Ensete ventricosum]
VLHVCLQKMELFFPEGSSWVTELHSLCHHLPKLMAATITLLLDMDIDGFNPSLAWRSCTPLFPDLLIIENNTVQPHPWFRCVIVLILFSGLIHRPEASIPPEEAHSPSLVLTADPKPRLRWMPDLQEGFVDAVAHLGAPESSYLFSFLLQVFPGSPSSSMTERCGLAKRFLCRFGSLRKFSGFVALFIPFAAIHPCPPPFVLQAARTCCR